VFGSGHPNTETIKELYNIQAKVSYSSSYIIKGLNISFIIKGGSILFLIFFVQKFFRDINYCVPFPSACYARHPKHASIYNT
jgi:hypothetical protein